MKKLPEIKLNWNDPHIQQFAKKIVFIDIETFLIDARIFRFGNQYIPISQINSTIKILTVAYGSLHDLHHKGEKGVKVLSNRKSKTFKKDPLDD